MTTFGEPHTKQQPRQKSALASGDTETLVIVYKFKNRQRVCQPGNSQIIKFKIEKTPQ
jgi:hypothetical protein